MKNFQPCLGYQEESEPLACKSWERSKFCDFPLVHTLCDNKYLFCHWLTFPRMSLHPRPVCVTYLLLDAFAYSLNLALLLAETWSLVFLPSAVRFWHVLLSNLSSLQFFVLFLRWRIWGFVCHFDLNTCKRRVIVTCGVRIQWRVSR